MRIEEIVKLGSNITLSVDARELREFARLLIKETKIELEAAILAENEERYLSPAETAKMLDVDLSTLWRWDKQKYLVPIRIGGKPRYKLTDIKRLLSGGQR